MTRIPLSVNGVSHELEADADQSLLSLVRDQLGLPGTKYSCLEGICGACTVHLDGQPVRCCVTAARDVAGRSVTTIEGLARDGHHGTGRGDRARRVRPRRPSSGDAPRPGPSAADVRRDPPLRRPCAGHRHSGRRGRCRRQLRRRAPPDPETAAAAVRALRPDWNVGAEPSEDGIVEYLRDHPVEAEAWYGTMDERWGDVEAAFARSARRLDATCTAAYLAHVPLETRDVRVDDDDRLEVLRLVSAFGCGRIVNPENLRNQIEGAAAMGLGGALFEAVHFDHGRILTPTLKEYRVPRMHDILPIDVVLIDRPDLPSAGAGETPIVAVAPAIANAIFAATGIRLRSMPLAPDGMVDSPIV